MHNLDLSEKELATLKLLRNSIAHEGFSPSTRQLMKGLGYKSPYSVLLILKKLEEVGYIKRRDGKVVLLKDLEGQRSHARTISIPLVGTAPCGSPLLAEQNIEAMLPVSISLATAGSKYFLLRALGDSMNKKGINSGDLVLVRQQNTAETGDVVVALIDDEATIKELEFSKDVVLLKPRSTNSDHKPIILNHDFQVQGKVIATIPQQADTD